MILCIAEKPSVGRDIARVLGANTQRDGLWKAMAIVYLGLLDTYVLY